MYHVQFFWLFGRLDSMSCLKWLKFTVAHFNWRYCLVICIFQMWFVLCKIKGIVDCGLKNSYCCYHWILCCVTKAVESLSNLQLFCKIPCPRVLIISTVWLQSIKCFLPGQRAPSHCHWQYYKIQTFSGQVATNQWLSASLYMDTSVRGKTSFEIPCQKLL